MESNKRTEVKITFAKDNKEDKILVLSVVNASYIDGYKLSIHFNTGKNRVVDFSKFIATLSGTDYAAYQQTKHFKKFKIDQGNVVWGKNWDLIFPLWDLYSKKII